MKIFAPLVIAVFVYGCHSPPKLPTDSASICMIETVKSIVEAKNAHSQVKGNISKEGQCSSYAYHQKFISELGGKRRGNFNNAAGEVVVQNITSINSGSSIYERSYSECLKNPNITARWAPPAYSQFEKTLYGLKTISANSCPADFKQDFEEYKAAYAELLDLSKSYPAINTLQWTDIVKLKIPGNDDEKLVIENDKKIGQTHSKMVQKIRERTGWCPSSNMKSFYPCK